MKEKPFQRELTPRQFRHKLIQEEYRNVLENSNYEIPGNTEALVILSLSPRGWHTDANRDQDWPEDVACIKFGIEVYKNFTARKLNKVISEITPDDLKGADLPYFVLNGATEQEAMMRRIAKSLGFPEEKTTFLNCGDHKVANTKTQFTDLVAHPILGKLKNIAVVSANYHVPRVARTASVNLPADVNFDVLGIPFDDAAFDVYRKVKGEVKKIIEYQKKGDVSRYPREKTK